MMEAARVLGLISGTSADGIDAAAVECSRQGSDLRVKFLAGRTTPYPDDLRRAILAAGEGRPQPAIYFSQLNAAVGETFARAALDTMAAAGVGPEAFLCIASHGQTIAHHPAQAEVAGVMVASTWQIGEPAILAERTGLPVISDFRQADLAAGGQGAPLVPYADARLFGSADGPRAVLNIGGIANLTYLPAAALDGVLAFDTGPGNMILDALVTRLTGGARRQDEGGALAQAGAVHREMLDALLAHPYLRQSPPKSTGREMFGAGYVAGILERWGHLPANDLLATAAAFTVETIASALRTHLPARPPLLDLVVAGGGVHNHAIMHGLITALAPLPVRRTDELGIPADFREAVAFALLGYEALAGRPTNVPSATGAGHARILGNITPGWRRAWGKELSGRLRS